MKWTKEEVKFLTDNSELGATYIAEQLNRTISSIYNKAFLLKIKLDSRIWSEEEEQFLLDNAEKGSTYISQHLNRTPVSIMHKAARLGISLGKFWTKEEQQFLIDNAEQGSGYIAKKLNRTAVSIRHKAVELQVKLGSYVYWVEKDTELLKEIYSTSSPTELSSMLDRTSSSIVCKANLLGLKKEKSLNKENTTGYLYVVFFPELNLYKVGITNNPKKRLGEFGVNCNLLSLLEGKYSEIEKLEKYLLNFIKPWLVNSKKLRSGNSETYWVENSS